MLSSHQNHHFLQFLFLSILQFNLFQSMNFQDISTPRSPKRELQGPRPTPLRINKDSHKIKKPPLAPPPPSQPQAPPRQPVIIYTVSPKIIHTTPSDFMSLVQRLTGSSSSSSSSSSSLSSSLSTSFDSYNISSSDPLNGNNSRDMISPAACYASMEKDRSCEEIKQQCNENRVKDERIEIEGYGVERSNMFHGILSPGPASLSPIPSSFFSPPSITDPNNMVSFLHDLSPVLHSNKNFMEGTFIFPSPSNFISPHTSSIDLFNNFSD